MRLVLPRAGGRERAGRHAFSRLNPAARNESTKPDFFVGAEPAVLFYAL